MAHVLIIVLTLLVGATAAAIIITQTAWFKDWLRGYIVRSANEYVNGQVSIERLGGNLFFGVELEDIGVSMDGSEVVAVKDLGIDYNVFSMLSRGLSVDDIRLNQPVLYLRRDGDAWSITRLIKKQTAEADREGPARPITIDAIGVSDASIVIDDPVGTAGVDVPDRIDRIDARLSFQYEPVHYSIDISHVSFRGAEPQIGLNALSGGIAVRDDTIFIDSLSLRTEESTLHVDGAIQDYTRTPIYNLQVSSDKISIPEIARVVPSLAGVDLQPAFEVKAAGPLDHLQVDLNVRSSAGEITGSVVADVQAPKQAVAGNVGVRHLNLAPILRNPQQQTDLTASARVDVRGDEFTALDSLRGTVHLDAPSVVAAGYAAERVNADLTIQGRRVGVRGRLTAYSAGLTTQGRVTLAGAREPLSYDLRGAVQGLDLRRLPRQLNVPPAATAVAAEYRVRGAETQERAVDGEVRFRDSTVAGARIAGGSTAAVSMRGREASYQADLSVADVDLERIGREFDVPALASARYASTLNGRIAADGRGTRLEALTLTAKGELHDSSILGGSIPNLTFAADAANDRAHLTASGRFTGFDPAVVSGKPQLKGTVGGMLDADATIAGLAGGVTADNVEGTVRLALEPSNVGGLAIERAGLDADYRNRTGEIRQLEVVGRDINVHAAGTLALNDSGESNLKFQADSPSLEELGRLFDVPMAGIGKIDGTVTGNRRELRAQGTVIGNGVKYQENGALALNTSYDATIPDLDVERAAVTADTKATFVTVAGQNINELAARTVYEGNEVTFDATATQPERSVNAGGALVIHPDHQEVHLRSLALDSRGVQWQLDAAASPVVNYANERVTVQNVRLVNGEQLIEAEGAFGQPDDTLRVSMNNVDLANVDALMLRPPQLGGRLNATAVVSGTRQAPQVDGEFQIAQGSFRAFKYDAFGGTVTYADRGVAADVRLQQNASQWITAKGSLPIAAFAAADDLPAAEADRPIDFAIDSSTIDLGMIQGFTEAVTEVGGTLEAHVRITGTAAEPLPDGAITIRDGQLTVAPTGVTYTGIAGDVAIDPDRLRIDKIAMIDNHSSPLSISGELAIDARRLEGVRLSIAADDFKVIDNAMGNVRVESALEIVGDLKAPQVSGSLAVTTGEIDLDAIMALAGPSAYATQEIEYSEEGQVAAPGLLDRVAVDVNLRVPDDLVVRADSLQTPGSSFSLGALNVTLGGDVQVTRKAGGPILLVGAVNTVRGTYDFQGRRFEILRDGTVRFEGLEELNPRLDIRTRRIIRAVEARVNVRGTLREPEIVLSSIPPQEQVDILSLIVFNAPVNELGAGQQVSLAQRAQGIATGAVAGQLAESIGNALQLDTFEINLAPETGNAAELTLGQQVGENLYVRVQQGVGEQNTTNFILEYELTDWLRLQTNVIQGSSTQQSLFQRAQGSGGDLIFFFSY
jgi:autotransporter translocation and assembly factor TamB